MHRAHPPKSLCLTLRSAALQGGKVPVACGSVSSHPCVSVPWAAGPSDPCGEHSFVQAVRPQCPQSVVRPPTLCPRFTDERAVAGKGHWAGASFPGSGPPGEGEQPFLPWAGVH